MESYRKLSFFDNNINYTNKHFHNFKHFSLRQLSYCYLKQQPVLMKNGLHSQIDSINFLS